jgi:adenylate cyclase
LKVGIGVNHGKAIVGNLGCEAKMEVSLIGDAVNTASRFEGMTKQFHVDILIGETAEQFIREEFHVRTVALTLPKGKTKPVEVFTVVDDRTVSPTPPAWLPVYEEGVKLYREREFTGAIARFEKVLEALPNDWLAADYLAACRGYAEEPPPADWNGVNVMTSK